MTLPVGAGVAASSLDELAARLVALRAEAGNPSYAEITRRVARLRRDRGESASSVPGRVTVYECFRPGRRRVDVDLVSDIVRVLGYADQVGAWRSAVAGIEGRAGAGSIAAVAAGLPPQVPHLVGRCGVVEAIVASPEPVTLVVGMPGVGKTSVAVAAAARLAPSYDRVLFAALRGFDPDLPPVDGFAVVGALLRECGADPVRIRDLGPGERGKLLRTLVRRTPTLVVLDNAADAEHVRAVLAALQGARVVVTSRHDLAGPAGEQVLLEPLSAEDSVALLASFDPVWGRSEHRDEAAAIAQRCGHLPLALTVAGSRLAERPGWSPADQRERLLALPADERVRSSMATSFVALDPETDRVLRCLALHPSGRVTTDAAAAVTGLGVEGVAPRLGELVAHCLLQTTGPDAFHLHDVVRDQALDRGCDLDAASERDRAMAGLAEHYAVAAAEAVRVVLGPGAGSPEEAQAARAWLDAETDGAVATAFALADQGRIEPAVDIAEVWANWLEYTNRKLDAEPLLHIAIRHPDPARRQFAAGRLARLARIQSRVEEALSWAGYALELNPRDYTTLTIQASVYVDLARYQEAYALDAAAQALAEEAGDELWAARLTGNVAVAAFQVGAWRESLDAEASALEASRRHGDLRSETNILVTGADRAARVGDVARMDDLAEQLRRLVEFHGLSPSPPTSAAGPRSAWKCAANIKRRAPSWRPTPRTR